MYPYVISLHGNFEDFKIFLEGFSPQDGVRGPYRRSEWSQTGFDRG